MLALVLAVGIGVWRLGYVQAVGQVAQRGQADLALASDRLIAQLRRYQEAAVLIAGHPVLGQLARGEGGAVQATDLLISVSDKTSALGLAFVAPDGTVLAQSSPAVPGGLGQIEAFGRAMDGALGSGHGRAGPERQRVFYYAAPSYAADGHVQGALIVIADLETVEFNWRIPQPAVYFADAGGQVFISNRPELRRRPGIDGAPAPSVADPAVAAHDVAGYETWRLDLGPYLPTRALHLVQDLPVIGMQGEALVDLAPARRIAMLQASVAGAILLFFGALLVLATERRRTLAEANAVLEARVAARTEALSAANTSLRHEVAERLEAEARLRRAQEELVQAAKLSALGRMSAGISHELNQPLMAIRQYAVNGAAFLGRDKPERAGENLGRISDLADRMARIIRNLRAFARNESEPMGRVDMVAVLNSALELVAARLDRDGIAVTCDLPDGPVWVRGGEVRLGQVVVNLITNAADAMTGREDRRLGVTLDAGDRVRLAISDTGPGIEDPARLFEPFYTTKKVGAAEGLGLGLSISYGLVQSFGGDIRGENLATGGARFTVELTPWQDEAQAA
ncbi:ATP-binding protein [Mesobacterium pallidum]|uniref:sensor histidine kinase n=1 Tax=Mesobacterium pallidum TaxID=2872037 RepID=UPI001EE29769|nr:ATP-binding protein [Mesobacterium pallidum]